MWIKDTIYSAKRIRESAESCSIPTFVPQAPERIDF